MTFPTQDVGEASSKHSRVYLGNNFGGFFTVASVTTDTVTLDDGSLLTGTSQYTSSEPGQLVIIDGQADSDDGKVANITAVSGNDLTVDVDFATGAALADGDMVAVIPPLSVRLLPDGGHTLSTQVNRDEDRGVSETFLTQDSPITTDVPSGDIPLFAPIDSPGLGRLLAAFFGAYKLSGTSEHVYRFQEDDDGTFTKRDEFFVLSQDGDDVLRQVFLGLFGQSITMDFPNEDSAGVTVSAMGAEALREIGGTGKAFTEGSSNWIRDLPCDTGDRHVAKGAFLQLGGSFGDALDKDAADRFFQSLSIEGSREPTQGRPLGRPYRAKMEEFENGIQVTGTRILKNSTLTDDYYGGGPEIEGPNTTRMLIKAISPQDSTKFIKVDIPNGEYTVLDERRQRGLFEQDFTFRASHALAADGCPDTSTPLAEVRYENGDATNYLATV